MVSCWVQVGALAVVVATATGCGQGAAASSAQPRTWQPADPGAGELVQVYAPSAGGVTGLAVAPDGTLYALAEVAGGAGDEEVSRTLVVLSADGRVEPVDGPAGYETPVPLCTGADGALFAAHRGAVVRLGAGGEWSAVTAEEPSGPDVDGGLTHSGDGGPAVKANVAGPRDCTVTPDGSLLVAEVCAIRRIALDGTISTVVGREDPGGGVWWGCVTGTAETQTTEDMAPVPVLSGPGAEVALTGVQGVAAGAGGRVWFTTSLGLRSLEPDGTVRTWQTPEYGAKDGIELRVGSFEPLPEDPGSYAGTGPDNLGAPAVTPDGTVFLGSTPGLLSLHPDDGVLRLARPREDLPLSLGAAVGDDLYLHGFGGIWRLGP